MVDAHADTGDDTAYLPQVVLSAGTKNFHLLMSAEEVHRRGCLKALICGPYPTVTIKRWIGGLPFLARLLRREVRVPSEKVFPVWAAEIIQALAFLIRRLRKNPTHSTVADLCTLRYYQTSAVRVLRRLNVQSGIYHYRAAFGGSSVEVAKSKGLVTICDHSLADPHLLPSLVRGDAEPTFTDRSELDTVSRAMCEDIEAADAILVNSDFVKETLVGCGCDPCKIHVNYLGVDDAFVSQIPAPSLVRVSDQGALGILFAGHFSYRKGADILVGALQRLEPSSWSLTIAGAIDPRLADELGEFMRARNVHLEGVASRNRLAQLMVDADVFVLPSRAEGSARVVFEAMACGCPIITTRESGSIVEDLVHGRLVRRDSVSELTNALGEVMNERPRFRAMGRVNRDLVLGQYRQAQYGERLVNLYRRLLS